MMMILDVPSPFAPSGNYTHGKTVNTSFFFEKDENFIRSI